MRQLIRNIGALEKCMDSLRSNVPEALAALSEIKEKFEQEMTRVRNGVANSIFKTTSEFGDKIQGTLNERADAIELVGGCEMTIPEFAGAKVAVRVVSNYLEITASDASELLFTTRVLIRQVQGPWRELADVMAAERERELLKNSPCS